MLNFFKKKKPKQQPRHGIEAYIFHLFIKSKLPLHPVDYSSHGFKLVDLARIVFENQPDLNSIVIGENLETHCIAIITFNEYVITKTRQAINDIKPIALLIRYPDTIGSLVKEQKEYRASGIGMW